MVPAAGEEICRIHRASFGQPPLGTLLHGAFAHLILGVGTSRGAPVASEESGSYTIPVAFSGYGKLRRKGTEFVRMNQEFMPYEQGIFIDLMPFDNVPDGWMSKRVHFFRCFLYRKLFWSEVGSRAEKNPGKRLVYKIIRRIPMNMIIRRYQRFIDRCQRKKTQSVRILTFPTPKGVYGYERRWYTHLSKYPFGDMILPGAQDYDGYLRVKYGDYMQLPPAEKQKTHPVSKLKLPER